MDYLEKGKRVLDIEILELNRLRERLDEGFSSAVQVIKEAVDNRGKVVVLGVGKSGQIGAKIASTLTSTGSPAVILDSVNALHGDLGMVSDGDVVLALSASGETEELLRILPAIARFKVRIIAICGNAGSTLAQNADIVLNVEIEQEACPLNLAPTSSTTVMLALGDALAMVLLEARGFNKEDFARFHPAGSLGRKLVKVEAWGRRKLAYPVKKQRRGVYVYVKFVGAGGLVQELERNLKLQDAVLKFQTVTLREQVDMAGLTVDPEEVKFARLELAPEAEQEESREKVLGLIEAPDAPRPRREDEDEYADEEIAPESTGTPESGEKTEKKEEEG